MTLKNVKVKPNPDKTVSGNAVQVIHPFQSARKINKNGEEIQDCSFIRRRLKDGDLVFCDKKKQAAFEAKGKAEADSEDKAKAKLDEQLEKLLTAADISEKATSEEIQKLITEVSEFGDKKEFAKHDGYAKKLDEVKSEVTEKLEEAFADAVKREAKGN